MVIIVMGVAGAGKTTVGTALADALGWGFLDADDLHPPANVRKMARGEPLTDADREPWLEALRAAIAAALARGESRVVACSALKAAYRTRLRGNEANVVFVHLDAPRAVLAQRLAHRAGHFAGPDLLGSQLATLEPPEDAAVIANASAPPAAVVEQIRRALGM